MSHAHAPVFVACRRGAAALVACLAALLTLQVVQAPAAAAATPSMYQGPAFPNVTGTAPTEDKPQSKLWFNDGSWWALMRTNVNGADGNPDITVHKLEGNHTWTNTGTVVDGRAGSSGDALWEGGNLYVASRVTSGDIRAVKLSYDTNTDRYSVVFSKSIPGGAIESVTIARDSKARLWVTFTKPKSGSTTLDEVWVAHSTTNETTWTAPFRIPGVDSEVRADDISAIVAFGGKIGVMWSDQQSSLVRFAVHQDSATSDTTGWTFQTPITGTRSTDDHLNIKSLVEDDSGQVYAAIKTSRGDSTTDPQSDPSIRVLHRSASGTWTSGTAATVAEGLTRPQIALDTTNRLVYVVMSTEGGGSVYYKTAPFGASPKFTPATGTGPTMLAWSGALINNATLAKAPISAGSGLIVLASDEKNTRRYYHAELPLEGRPLPGTRPLRRSRAPRQRPGRPLWRWRAT